MSDLRDLLHAAAPRPPELNIGELVDGRGNRRAAGLRPFVIGLAVVAISGVVAVVAVNRSEGGSTPVAEQPAAPFGIAHEVTVATGQSDGESWTVFRGLGGRQGSDLCYRYVTTPPVPPEHASDGLPIFPEFCGPRGVPANALANNALLAKIAPLPSGATLIYGLVRGNVAQLGLVYSDGTSETYAVSDHSIALVVPAGKTLDKITGTFNAMPIECTPMISGNAPPAGSRALDGEYRCSELRVQTDPVPTTGPPANP